MKTRQLRRLPLACLAMTALGTIAVPASPAAAMPVFDASNYAENLLQAARALEQINNQVQSLQNEASMLQNMARNLERIDFPELKQMTSALQQVEQLMGKAQAIDFNVDGLDEKLDAMFPGAAGAVRSDARVAGARSRLDSAMAAFRHSMAVQARVVANVRDDAGVLGQLSAKSDAAAGGLHAQQAANQLLALSAKQQLQLQQLLAAEFRSQSLERARHAEAETEAREATRRFLGSGKAPRPGRD